MICDSCMYKHLCKYESKMRDKISEISDKENDFITILSCKFYSQENLYTQPSNINKNDLFDELSCDSCDFYKTMLKNNKTYIGDTPCTFCHKNRMLSSY